jgi:hypothetical protein
MAERSVGRRVTRSRIIEPGRIPAFGGIVYGSGSDGALARDTISWPADVSRCQA